jgi:primosomal protein N' (replication factor Y)
VSANSQVLSIEGAREIKKHLKKINDLEVMGPVDSPLLRIKKKYRSRLLIRFEEKSLKQKLVSKLLNSLKISNKIKLTVDVDPVNFG